MHNLQEGGEGGPPDAEGQRALAVSAFNDFSTRCYCFLVFQDADVKSEKVVMEDRLTLKASAPWLSAPSALMLASNGRNFEIEVCCKEGQCLFC